MKILATIVLTVLAVAVGLFAYVTSGAFDVAADTPHGPVTRWLATTVREHSIGVRANDVTVPRLDDPDAIARGANEYAEMCAGCHLAPGMPDNEFRRGLNPPAPELAKARLTAASDAAAARQFWIVKHGIKMSAMPAWGLSHDDATLWSIVAFVRRLPTLTPEQYAQMTADSASAHETHDHGDGEDE